MPLGYPSLSVLRQLISALASDFIELPLLFSLFGGRQRVPIHGDQAIVGRTEEDHYFPDCVKVIKGRNGVPIVILCWASNDGIRVILIRSARQMTA
jgi:hypothetical protein